MINPQPVQGSRSPYSSTPGTDPKLSSQNRSPLSQPPSGKKPKKRWKKVVTAVVAALIIGGVTYGISLYFALKNNIIVTDSGTKDAAILNYDPNKADQLDATQFKKPDDGRVNILVVGVDNAATLTDSIEVISVDTINKQSSITSIPRDLYVTIPGYGRSKINAAYRYAEGNKAGTGSALLKTIVGSILNIDITNYALTDFKGLEDLVDSLGGVDVTVTQAIDDPFFPANVGDGFAPFSISAGPHHLDGKTALRYARSRETTSDFDRARRQQQIIDALRKKALSAGVLANPVKITNILQALGHSFKTDLQVSQIKTLLGIFNTIPSGKNTSFVLDTSTDLGLLNSSSNTPAGYISFPILGFDHYSGIQRWFHKNNPDPLLTKESPVITVANGGKATTKQLSDFADTLRDYGYTVLIDTTYTPKTKGTSTLLYGSNTSKKPISTNYLGDLLSTSVQSGKPLNSSSDFEVIYSPSTVVATPSPTILPTSDK